MRMTWLLTAGPAIAFAVAGIAGCGGDSRPGQQRAPAVRAARLVVAPAATSAPGVRPGIDAAALLGAASNPYTGKTDAIVAGRRLFNAFNCSGCHSGYAGGGMGPNLRDTVWIYGSSDADLYATISAGRPNGMPAWAGRIPPDQIWQIIAYIRTLGTAAEPEKPPTPTRTTTSHNPADKAG